MAPLGDEARETNGFEVRNRVALERGISYLVAFHVIIMLRLLRFIIQM